MAPYLGGFDMSNRMGPVVAHFMGEALQQPAFRSAVLMNLAAHLAMLLVLYPLYAAVYRAIHADFKVRGAFAAVGAALLLWVLIFGWNQWFFEKSRHQWIADDALKPIVVIATLLVLGALFRRFRQVRFTKIHGSAALLLLTLVVVSSFGGFGTSVQASAGLPRQQPNVILIGVDSLSQGVFERHPEAMPVLSRLSRQAVVYTNAWTPMARTCPSWMSVLSGRAPAEHGAIFNLVEGGRVDRVDLLSSSLKRQGVQTIFSLDERRFCGIDESYGFDRVVGPDHGALDFVVQKFNDSPLVNFLLQTQLSKWILPYSGMNVAASATYDADDFVDATLQAMDPSKSLFMVVHLESAHFPFVAREAKSVSNDDNLFRRQHLNALTVVDRQIDQLLDGLKASGRLDDAIVVILSDHGESFGDMRPVRLLNGAETNLAVYGHGTSVLEHEQHHVVLMNLRYKNGRVVSRAGREDRQVSLMDLRGLVEHSLQSDALGTLPERECLTFETGIRVAALMDYKNMNEKSAAEASAHFYAIDSEARMHLRPQMIGDLVDMKDLAVKCGSELTAFDASDAHWRSYVRADGGLREIPLRQSAKRMGEAYMAQLKNAAERQSRLLTAR
jgi:arylsulfatase A-like enzyme